MRVPRPAYDLLVIVGDLRLLLCFFKEKELGVLGRHLNYKLSSGNLTVVLTVKLLFLDVITFSYNKIRLLLPNHDLANFLDHWMADNA